MKKLIAALCAVLIAVLCGCSGGSAKELGAVFSDVKQQVSFENFKEFSDPADLTKYYGILPEQVREFSGGVNTTGVEQEEIVLVRAADNAAADSVREALDKRYQAKLNQNKNYNPEQAELISACSVERYGDYVTMIVSPNAAKITEIFRKDTGV